MPVHYIVNSCVGESFQIHTKYHLVKVSPVGTHVLYTDLPFKKGDPWWGHLFPEQKGHKVYGFICYLGKYTHLTNDEVYKYSKALFWTKEEAEAAHNELLTWWKNN